MQTMQRSDSIGALTKALIQFHRKCPKIPKSSKNTWLKTRYADLSTILEIVQPVLCEVGLAIQQHPTPNYGLTTILSHESGEWISSSYEMQPLESVVDKDAKTKAITPQSIGSVITYQRRYAIGAVLSLNIDDDNDGNPPDAEANATPAPPKKTAKEIMEEKAAKRAAAEAEKQTETGSSKTTPTTTVTVTAESSTNANSTNVNEKCSEADVAEIKSLLNQWEQQQKGISAEFVANLKASGRSKIADFTIAEASQVKSAITAKALSAFFGNSLERKSA